MFLVKQFHAFEIWQVEWASTTQYSSCIQDGVADYQSTFLRHLADTLPFSVLKIQNLSNTPRSDETIFFLFHFQGYLYTLLHIVYIYTLHQKIAQTERKKNRTSI